VIHPHICSMCIKTGSRNLTGPKTLPTIWHTYTYMKLVTKYQISAINSCWEKCDEKYLGRTEVKQYTPPAVERGYNNMKKYSSFVTGTHRYEELSWSYGSWIYNLPMQNQCLSPLTLWVRIPFKRGVLNTTLCDNSLSVTCGRLVVFSPGTLVSSTNKTVRHDITEVLLKLALNTIPLTHSYEYLHCII